MPRQSTNGRADNLHGIVVFLRVVDAGSLSRAARSLGAGRGQEDVRRIRRLPRRAAAQFYRPTRTPGSEKGAAESYPYA
jgi:DNA-binding transcriptional LysR family regulator